jgi:uncharacterized protein (DUF2147 family)
MRNGIKPLAALAAALLMAAPTVAQEATPAGLWRTGPGDVKVEFQFCGKNNQELCGWLRYARDKSPRVQRYMNKMVMERAERVGARQWKGDLVLSGHRVYGTMKLAKRDRLKFDGCVALIICGEFNLYRDD